jgi:hypothetical protein
MHTYLVHIVYLFRKAYLFKLFIKENVSNKLGISVTRLMSKQIFINEESA